MSGVVSPGDPRQEIGPLVWLSNTEVNRRKNRKTRVNFSFGDHEIHGPSLFLLQFLFTTQRRVFLNRSSFRTLKRSLPRGLSALVMWS